MWNFVVFKPNSLTIPSEVGWQNWASYWFNQYLVLSVQDNRGSLTHHHSSNPYLIGV